MLSAAIAFIFQASCISATLAAPQSKRSIMYWMVGGAPTGKPEPASVWKERVANVSKHRENVTSISPCIHGITSSGTFGNEGQGLYSEVAPYLPEFQDMGLNIVPIIYNKGGLGGMQRLLSKEGSQAFIKAAIDKAVEMGYSGYNMDNELRGEQAQPQTWAYLKPFAEPWIGFLNEFADALHAKNMTLSVDIQGCCGWIDQQHLKVPAGHCGDPYVGEFVATTCAMYRQSRLDRVIGMGTYSDSISNTSSPYSPQILKEMAEAASKAIGVSKYGLGFKGGWHADRFGETAKETIRYLRDRVGVQHVFHWVNEPLSQADWDAWGFFLHDGLDGNPSIVV